MNRIRPLDPPQSLTRIAYLPVLVPEDFIPDPLYPDLLPRETAARYLGCSLRVLDQLRADGLITGHLRGARRWFTRAELTAYQARSEREQQAARRMA